MNRVIKKLLSLLVIMAMIITVVPQMSVFAEEDYWTNYADKTAFWAAWDANKVSASLPADWVAHNIGSASLNAQKGTNYIVYGTTGANNIAVPDGYTGTIVLDSVDIRYTANTVSPIGLTGSANVKIVLRGDNALQALTGSGGAGIGLAAASTVTIESFDGSTTPKLFSQGGGGAGIGSQNRQASGTVIINSGNIEARGDEKSYASAGIGGSYSGSGGTIVINGGVIYAKGCNGFGAGIGGGRSSSFNSVTINGGTITAVGSPSSAAIGFGAGASTDPQKSKIVINGGTINATANNGNAAAIGGSDVNVGNIIITGGDITVSKGATGIGGGNAATASGGNIIITGGTLRSIQGNGAAIGGGVAGVDSVVVLPGANVMELAANKGNAFIGNADKIFYLNGSDTTYTNGLDTSKPVSLPIEIDGASASSNVVADFSLYNTELVDLIKEGYKYSADYDSENPNHSGNTGIIDLGATTDVAGVQSLDYNYLNTAAYGAGASIVFSSGEYIAEISGATKFGKLSDGTFGTLVLEIPTPYDANKDTTLSEFGYVIDGDAITMPGWDTSDDGECVYTVEVPYATSSIKVNATATIDGAAVSAVSSKGSIDLASAFAFDIEETITVTVESADKSVVSTYAVTFIEADEPGVYNIAKRSYSGADFVSGENYTIYGTTTENTVSIPDGYTGKITLRDLDIKTITTPLTIGANTDVTLFLEGENSLFANAVNVSAIQTNATAKVTFDADKASDYNEANGVYSYLGSLEATGNGASVGNVGVNNSTIGQGGGTLIFNGGKISAISKGGFGSAPGIGSGNSGINIIINGGDITGQGINMSAGIGSGRTNAVTNITINGGKITGRSLSGGAGIGTGAAGTVHVLITGGDIYAASEAQGAPGTGIGLGSNNAGADSSVVITGGNISAKGVNTGAVIGGLSTSNIGTVIILPGANLDEITSASNIHVGNANNILYLNERLMKDIGGSGVTTTSVLVTAPGADDGIEAYADFSAYTDLLSGFDTETFTLGESEPVENGRAWYLKYYSNLVPKAGNVVFGAEGYEDTVIANEDLYLENANPYVNVVLGETYEKVAKAENVFSSIDISIPSLTLPSDFDMGPAGCRLRATLGPENRITADNDGEVEVIWTSSNPEVATVISAGVIVQGLPDLYNGIGNTYPLIENGEEVKVGYPMADVTVHAPGVTIIRAMVKDGGGAVSDAFVLTVTDASGINDVDQKRNIRNSGDYWGDKTVKGYWLSWPEAEGEASVAMWRGNKVMAYSPTADDTTNVTPQVDAWVAISKDYGVKPSAGYVSSTWNTRSFLTETDKAAMRKYIENGLGVISHSWSHGTGQPLKDTMTTAEQLYEISEPVTIIEGITGIRPATMLIAGGSAPNQVYCDNGSEEQRAYFFSTVRNSYVFVAPDQVDYMSVRMNTPNLQTDLPKFVDPNNALYGGWLVTIDHGITYDGTSAYLSDTAYQTNKDKIWNATIGEAGYYAQERDTSELEVLSTAADLANGSYRFNLTDKMYDGWYSTALTVKIKVPDSWANGEVTATQNGKPINVEVVTNPTLPVEAVGTYVLVDAVPDAGVVVVTNGEADTDEVVYGDANGDGNVNALDRAVVSRYIAKWETYTSLTNAEAADLNVDGNVNALDRAILSRHIAKWAGYDVLPKK